MPEININSTYGLAIIQDMKAVYVDENYAKIYGYNSADDLLSSLDSFLELIPSHQHETAMKNYYDTIGGNVTPHGHTFTNIDRNGKEFVVFSVDHVVKWQGLPALQVTVIDMSSVVESNMRIREHSLMYKRLITDSGQGILIHRDFKPLLVNKSLVGLLKADSIEQVLNMSSLLEFIPEHHVAGVVERYNHSMSGGKGSSHVTETLCFDGEHRFFTLYDNLIEWEGEPAIQVTVEDVTDKVRLEKILAYRATHDELTDLFNRRAIYDWLEVQFDRHVDLTCMLLDIDDFKKINDRFGHLMGDEVICTLAGIIKKVMSQTQGVAGRWGGEEFIAFIPECNEMMAQEIAEKIRMEFYDVLFTFEVERFHASVSIGVNSKKCCRDIERTEDLIRASDRHLYLAKAAGKNRVHVSACWKKLTFSRDELLTDI